ncbi:MAG: methyltransferase domain-containing protein [Candidatus Helarchaeota archaeon]|nr:methyltransferase domain-containing protein [Candidatus Helarchaeota archaeon]
MEWNPTKYLENSRMQFSIGELAINKLNPQKSEAILDLGCGIGNLTACIAERTTPGTVIGIDPDPNMIAYANAMLKANPHPNLTFIQMDGINIPFQKEFNAVFSNIVIHWIKPLQLLWEKIYNSLRPGGRIQIATIFDDSAPAQDANSKENVTLEPKMKISQIELPIMQNFMIKGHFTDILSWEEFQAYQSQVNPNLTYKVYKIPELEEMLKKAGFKDIRIDQQTFWHEFCDPEIYLEYRKSNLWLYFLGYFPEKFRPQLAEKLANLIREEWNNLPAGHKELPIQEKWPILFIHAKKW